MDYTQMDVASWKQIYIESPGNRWYASPQLSTRGFMDWFHKWLVVPVDIDQPFIQVLQQIDTHRTHQSSEIEYFPMIHSKKHNFSQLSIGRSENYIQLSIGHAEIFDENGVYVNGDNWWSGVDQIRMLFRLEFEHFSILRTTGCKYNIRVCQIQILSHVPPPTPTPNQPPIDADADIKELWNTIIS
jgi:hypothetical protein